MKKQQPATNKLNLHNIAKSVDQALEDANKELEGINSKVHTASTKLNTLNKQIDKAAGDLATAKKELATFEESAQTTIDTLDKTIEEKRAAAATAEREATKAAEKLTELGEQVVAEQKQVKSLRDIATDLQDTIDKLTAERDTIAAQVKEERKAKDVTIEKLGKRVDELTANLGATKRNIEAAKVQGGREIEELNEKKETLEASVTKLEAREAKLIDTIAELEDKADRTRTETTDAMKALQKKENEINGRERAVKLREDSLSQRLRRRV